MHVRTYELYLYAISWGQISPAQFKVTNEQIKGWFQVWFNDVCVFLTVTRSHSCVSCLSVENRAKHLHEKNPKKKSFKNKTGWEVMSDGWCTMCERFGSCSSKRCLFTVLLLLCLTLIFRLSRLKTLSSPPFTHQMHFFNTNYLHEQKI